MAVIFNKVNSFTESAMHKKHDFSSDEFMLALSANATPPDSGDAVLVDITQISYTNLSTRIVSVSASSQTAGVYKLKITDIDLTASGGSVATFRWLTLYNNTAVNKDIVGYYDKGVDVTLADGEKLEVDFDDAAGVLTLT